MSDDHGHLPVPVEPEAPEVPRPVLHAVGIAIVVVAAAALSVFVN
ncbi:MAG: hypothetical protein ACKO2C_05260 [Actinomycetes bacterium]